MKINLDVPDCAKHPRYRGRRKPRLTCEACWLLYILTKYGDEFVTEALRSLFESFGESAPPPQEAPTTRYHQVAAVG